MRETKTLARWCNLLSINSLPNTGVASPPNDSCHNTNTVIHTCALFGHRHQGAPLPFDWLWICFCGSPMSRAQAHCSLPKEGHGPGPLLDQPPFGGARSQRDRPGDCIFVELSAGAPLRRSNRAARRPLDMPALWPEQNQREI